MADKVKKAKTKVLDSCCPTTCGEYKPRLYIDLKDQDVSKLKGLTIGEDGEFMIRGKIVGLSQRSYDRDGETVKTGSIDVESYTVEIMGEDENEFDELVKDD